MLPGSNPSALSATEAQSMNVSGILPLRAIVRALLLLLLLVLPGGLMALADDAPPLPLDVQQGVEAALKARVASIKEEKNAEGQVWKRASYSRGFRRVDDAHYKVGL